MKRYLVRTAVVASIVTVALVAGACSQVGVSATGPLGSLQVDITDKPFPFEFIESAVITVERVDVRQADGDEAKDDDAGDEDDVNENEADDAEDSANDNADDAEDDDADDDDAEEDDEGGFVTIFEGPAQFNLIELQNGRTDLLALASVEAGSYDQMRLIVSEGVVRLTDGREFRLEVPSGEQTGIKLHFDFDVAADQETVLLLDVDLSRAFSAIPSGHIDDVSTIREFRFSPSVAMKLINRLEAGNISGIITDEQGAPVAGAVVTAYEDDVEVNTTSTGEDGMYVLGALSAGDYRVEVSAGGYADAEVTGVNVIAGQTTVGVNVVLAAAPAAEEL